MKCENKDRKKGREREHVVSPGVDSSQLVGVCQSEIVDSLTLPFAVAEKSLQ